MPTPTDLTSSGVHGTAARLAESLRSYLEAQYHIRNEAAIRERRALLEEAASVAQRPFVESTQVYELGEPYQRLSLPKAVKDTLVALAQLGVGVFSRPYVHQSRALEAFFAAESSDLIVATGTGSGKTESFLLPIIGQLALEAARDATGAQRPGCRALLLYPMNALVNDQNARIRRLFGSPEAAAIMASNRGRPVRFGTYTGRTPYPGPRTAQRDGERIAPLFESFYLPLLRDAEKVGELQAIGQWPAKDIESFFGAAEEEMVQTRRGPQRRRHWERRLLTQPSDRELMTRHEVQEACPDILITNYSMLEYMLMRPIERPIFSQTREWLQANPLNELVLVLDEAHMYRGAGGAEVALLLRRLAARLDVPRERVRYILTSASLGDDDAARRATNDFALDLTGLSRGSSRKFTLVIGERERRGGQRPGDPPLAAALASFDLVAFHSYGTSVEAPRKAVASLAVGLGWPTLEDGRDLADYLYDVLTGFGPLELLIDLVSGRACELAELQGKLFPSSAQADAATATLLAIASFARRQSDGRVLLPTRLHMFFRGLPGLFACADAHCACKRTGSVDGAIVGRLHTHLRDACDCGSRVYELFTHRECGGAFLRGYMTDPHGDFLWHQPSGKLREGDQAPLIEAEILIESEPRHEQLANCIEGWLDVKSGRLRYGAPEDLTGFRRVYLPDGAEDFGRSGLKFSRCPICNEPTLRAGRSAIMDHATKGEAPFANLVKTQLDNQPAVREEDRTFPNGGRKVLLFSDGRQKAARLARDIPREVEQDIFRQVLIVAAQKLVDIGQEARPIRNLYIAVLTVLRDFNLPLFDRTDATTIENEIEKLEKDHEGESLGQLLVDYDPGAAPPRYTIALLKQLCGRYYSLTGTSVGFLAPTARASNRLLADLARSSPSIGSQAANQLSLAWISDAADKYAFDRGITDQVRAKAAGFWTGTPGIVGRFSRPLRDRILGILGVDLGTLEKMEEVLRKELALKGGGEGYFIDPSKVRIDIALNQDWYQCQECAELRPFNLVGHCSACGADQVRELNPQESEYIRARKGFWRAPVQRALAAGGSLRGISVEEHTAQLSNRDSTRVHATTEQFELRFRDIRLTPRDRPIDVLSCTTTMEVGVDIGSLVAVGLRNVPPQRENYQQRAGRAGRRGSSVSSVLTFAQNGPHDSYYYHNPARIVAGAPRSPDIKTDNPKIARRHINAFLFQTYFHRFMDIHNIQIGGKTSALFRALGKASDFFHGEPGEVPTFAEFSEWLEKNVLSEQGDLRLAINTWLPQDLRTEPLSRASWIRSVTQGLVDDLEVMQASVPVPSEDGEDDDDDRGTIEQEELMDLLFDSGLLPSYAFPTDVTSFLIERLDVQRGSDRRKMVIVERPQQGIDKALSEYAPGRLIVINKETYRSGGVVANVLPTEHDRAASLFASPQTIIHCDNCSYVLDIGEAVGEGSPCPICGSELQHNDMIVPQVFLPEDGKALEEDDRDQEVTYATGAQFPVPVGNSDVPNLREIGVHTSYTVTSDRRLVTTNKGTQTDDRSAGFWICEKCGRSSTEEPTLGHHTRPYSIEPSFAGPRAPYRCNGTFRNVFLGHVFSTDLLLLRITVQQPLLRDTHETVFLRALEDGLYSIAEAFRLSASRHPQLDLDASEFGAGFRIVPPQEEDRLHLDVYLFDTLAGGAGYSELAGRYLQEVLENTLSLLENCPASCDRSCESCLRHYHNQHLKNRLDRHLGGQLLRYGLFGEIPEEAGNVDQARALRGLKRLLELDGFKCETNVKYKGIVAPLLVARGGGTLAVGIKPCFVADFVHSIDRLQQQGVRTLVLNEYVLRQNLPDEHQFVRRNFAN